MAKVQVDEVISSESEQEVVAGFEDPIIGDRAKALSKKIPKANGVNGASIVLGENGEANGSPSESHFKKFMKNSRRSRTRFGRGQPKKG